MFQIKYISSDYLQTTGSALLKMMQNNAMPILDLFVRESLQNSLDAALYNVNCVNVDYQIGKFKRSAFSSFYEEIHESINEKFCNNEYDFISIRDSNTIGLIGNKDGKIRRGDCNQNLGKLVFQIMHPQEREGAGGSWGIGKTIYYRLGKGFTIFYSRIKLDSGEFEERLVSSLVENENLENSILNKYDDGIGIAFFGQVDDSKKTCSVITNTKEIHSFLQVFSITPYKDNETGTLVLIPFIDKKTLLSDNKYEQNENNEPEPFWYQNIEDYLKYSIYRWYFPRMSIKFPNGAYLNASINGKKLDLEEYDYFFKLYDNMYSCILKDCSNEKIHVKKIIRKRDLENQECGSFAYCKVSKEELAMLTDHLPSPYAFVNSFDASNADNNVPIISFIRKPGMIISYKTNGEWTGNGITSSPNEYILGLFVLNSINKFKRNKASLEEYIRKGEKSDHIDWVDHPLDNGKKHDVVRSITKGISNILRDEYSTIAEKPAEHSTNRVLGKKMAKLVLPSYDFGKGSSSDGRGRPTTTVVTTKSTKVKMLENIDFDENGIKLKFSIKSKGKCKNIVFIPEITTANGYIALDKWIEEGIVADIIFDYLFVSILKYNGSSVILNKRIELNDTIEDKFEVELCKTNNVVTSIKLKCKCDLSFELYTTLHFRIVNRNTSFVIKSIINEVSKA